MDSDGGWDRRMADVMARVFGRQTGRAVLANVSPSYLWLWPDAPRLILAQSWLPAGSITINANSALTRDQPALQGELKQATSEAKIS